MQETVMFLLEAVVKTVVGISILVVGVSIIFILFIVLIARRMRISDGEPRTLGGKSGSNFSLVCVGRFGCRVSSGCS